MVADVDGAARIATRGCKTRHRCSPGRLLRGAPGDRRVRRNRQPFAARPVCPPVVASGGGSKRKAPSSATCTRQSHRVDARCSNKASLKLLSKRLANSRHAIAPLAPAVFLSQHPCGNAKAAAAYWQSKQLSNGAARRCHTFHQSSSKLQHQQLSSRRSRSALAESNCLPWQKLRSSLSDGNAQSRRHSHLRVSLQLRRPARSDEDRVFASECDRCRRVRCAAD
eukprot:SAG31_NODE_10388_length_1145_cov_0.843212_1_plen_223_part_10